ncbi:DUF928 domain-containing protein [Synechococcus sp. PCC 7335]|uniref:DUF928 domain-containing protein n=1 Tax=Synechococcus sp. (strain ATCC 29403 / PCC 7335) TaxID=91464 RepID=UPI00056F74F1|nr:DUF928 domain-containing protein [Synechococcus sp. PCC 7335]
MKHWFLGAIRAAVLVIATAWVRMDVANAIPFTPPADNSAPRSATGGASRGSFFTPPADNSAPRSATGGASRDNFFTPPTGSSAPRDTASGASRGDFLMLPPEATSPGSAEAAPQGLPIGQNEAGATSSSNASSNLGGVIPTTIASPTAESMLAVVPSSFYGTTLEARPTILVYVPASDTDTAVFSLKNEAKHTIYQMTLAVPKRGGVVAVEMPDEAPELVVSENYQWYVALHVEGELTPGSPFVDGWIKRIEPSAELMLALAHGEGLSNVKTLAQNGVWYDTVAQLARLQGGAQDNQAIANHWYELLESVGLADIATEPIVISLDQR